MKKAEKTPMEGLRLWLEFRERYAHHCRTLPGAARTDEQKQRLKKKLSELNCRFSKQEKHGSDSLPGTRKHFLVGAFSVP